MINRRIASFCAWFDRLKEGELPQPAADAQTELSHQLYYCFARELKRNWTEAAPSIDRLFSSDCKRAELVVRRYAKRLADWFHSVGRRAVDALLRELDRGDNELLRRIASPGGAFEQGIQCWADTIQAGFDRAAKEPLAEPPYKTLGAQAGRPELPLDRSFGIWARDELLGWPWRNHFLLNERLEQMNERDLDGWHACANLPAFCDPIWVDALKRLPRGLAEVHEEVAVNPWVHASVLTRVLEVADDGSMSIGAYEWAQQLVGPYQVWYLGRNGERRKDSSRPGPLVDMPIDRLNTAIVPVDPAVTYLVSAHARGYGLFLRFLAERIVAQVRDSGTRKSDDITPEDLKIAALAWRDKHPKGKQVEFARHMGVSPSYVSHHSNFKQMDREERRVRRANASELDLKSMQVRKRT